VSIRPDPRLARTRARALAAAYDLLLEVGFGLVTMDGVSARSGVAKSTLYRHWPTRDDLLREAFSERALAGTASGPDLRSSLLSYALAVAEGLRHVWGRAAASLAVEALDDPDQRRAQQVFVTGYTADLHGLVDAAVGRGEIDRSDRVAEVLDRLVGALFYRFLFVAVPLDRDFVTREVDHAVRELAPRGAPDTGQRTAARTTRPCR
jgi:AcrR family transcriptional regulator